ncbi:DUF6252 family protein [Psychroflexus aestuariivivens]|uniref:DUF6252 family protein n=1 Tax=Psychroflexus aestuariivivens TaxID=1795040 RepID=UPI000FD7885A|nr:DUF6252 family protein [Psychroflexus aestuariivivens]
MKNIFKNLSFIILFFFFSSCSNDDDNSNNLTNELPEATNIGANTAGAIVNGAPFVVNDKSDPFFRARYVNIFEENFLLIITIPHIEFINGRGFLSYLKISYTLSEINQNEILELNSSASELESGDGGIGELESSNDKFELGYFVTNQDNIGELIITHFDEDENIISGTFWFDAKSVDGKVVKVREGRFDIEL